MANYKDIKYEFPTSATTSGTFADARISEDSVTQHVSATDLEPIKSDLTALALREATNETSAAFNLPYSFIETFTDDTNLGTQTDGDRHDSGMWATYYEEDQKQPFYRAASDTWDFTTAAANNPTNATGATVVAWMKTINGTSWNTDGSTAGALLDYATTNGSYGSFFGTQSGSTASDNLTMHEPGVQSAASDATISSVASLTDWVLLMWRADAGTWTAATQFKLITDSSYATLTAMTYTGSNQTGWNGIDNGEDAAIFASPVTHARYGGKASSFCNKDVAAIGMWKSKLDDDEIIALANAGKLFDWTSDKGNYDSSADLLDYFKIYDSDGATTMVNSGEGTRNAVKQVGDGAWQSSADGLEKAVTATSATGTLIQAANTVGSAKTKVGGTMIYKDNAGTATIGTDLKIYFTCNGGTNWTEAASYNAITPVYASGIKQVRLGETTCTSGTDIRYKAVWANQASGKKTQLHGIGINY